MSDEFKKLFGDFEKDLEDDCKENEKICKSDEQIVSLYDGGAWYEIELSRCDTHPKMLEWIFHLTAKEWVTRMHIHLFICHVLCRFPELAPKDEC